jgi:hypothetical protein
MKLLKHIGTINKNRWVEFQTMLEEKYIIDGELIMKKCLGIK